jgi:hypothetical protein
MHSARVNSLHQALLTRWCPTSRGCASKYEAPAQAPVPSAVPGERSSDARESDPRAHFIRQHARIDERACWLKEGQAFHVPRMPLALSLCLIPSGSNFTALLLWCQQECDQRRAT